MASAFAQVVAQAQLVRWGYRGLPAKVAVPFADRFDLAASVLVGDRETRR